MKIVRFAILGCGKIGARHAEKLQEVSGARLVAVCDIVPERAESLSKNYNCRAYYNLNDLLQDKEIDFVNVCTPSGLHAEHSIQSLKNSKHVLCEKPMAIKTSDAIQMTEVARSKGKLLFVVKQNRYNPPVKLIRQLVNDGKLGKPIKCVVNMFWNRNDNYYKNDLWRGTLQLDGGTIYTQASHFVDLMLEFMGKPKSVFAYMGTQNHNIEVEDTGIVVTEFENGAFGAINYTTCAFNKNLEGSLALFGSKGTVKIGGEYLNTIDYFEVENMPNYSLEKSDASANDYGTYKGSMSNHDKVFEDIVSRFNDFKKNSQLVSGEDAVMTVKFIDKAIQSAKTGRKIYFS